MSKGTTVGAATLSARGVESGNSSVKSIASRRSAMWSLNDRGPRRLIIHGTHYIMMMAPDRGVPSRLAKPQRFRREGPGNRAAQAQRFPVEPIDRLAGACERAVDALHQIGNHAFVDRELAVGKELDEHGAEQRVVGRAKRNHRQGAQARGEVRNLQAPAARRRERG